MQQDFLFELGTEELPPKSLKTLLKAFAESVYTQMDQIGLTYNKGSSQIFATPRRLAIRIVGLNSKTPEKEIQLWGPPAKVAFDDKGLPTKAALVFAEKNNLDPMRLKGFVQHDGKIDKLCCTQKTGGEAVTQILPAIINQALEALPIAKRMRWGAGRAEFVRPVHWVLMLYGDDVINCSILDQDTGRNTRGHRFLSPGEIAIGSPAEYQQTLRNNYVEACFKVRREKIVGQVQSLAKELGGIAQIDRDLLDEVTALVEWPTALAGRFEERFLSVPREALVSSMSEHQKYFHVVDTKGALLPLFITVSNIESRDPKQVVSGNERVIRPRLTDAAFFFDQDRKSSLESRLAKLKTVVFQEKLGSLYDKSARVSRISAHIAAQIGVNSVFSARAGLLCKADLVSNMVLEFGDMQGIAGSYYAQNDGEPPEVASAIAEHYLPKYAGGELPGSRIAASVAMADRLDTLIGIFGVGEKPSGNKDPFALRRAAIGVLSIILEHKLDVGLYELLSFAQHQYQDQNENFPSGSGLVAEVLEYIMERLRNIYQDQGIQTEVFNAVAAKRLGNALDFHYRIEAVNAFIGLAEAEHLAAANKRVANILSKSERPSSPVIDTDLFQQDEERNLWALIHKHQSQINQLLDQQDYKQALCSLAEFRDPVDAFFDQVMVNVDNIALRDNRLNLLSDLRGLFLKIADISCLVPEKK